jgi:CRISPR system Cascade subunit CasE
MNEQYYLTVSDFSSSAMKKLRITDTYSWHRVIYSMFDQNRSDRNESSGIVWGLAKRQCSLSLRVYILSDRPVSESVDGSIEFRTIRVPEKLFQSEKYSFQVVLNPVVRKEGKTTPVKGRDNIIDWFIQLAQKNGFSVMQQGISLDKVFVDKFNDKHMKTMFIQKAFFSGILRVTDKELFKKAVTSGIGRSKTYGCGLLQIVPIVE